MTMVGIRELKAHLSKYLQQVAKGEAVAISVHGRQVATLIPTPRTSAESKMWDLVRRGKIDWNGGRLDFKNRKLIKVKGKPLSQTVIDLRREERY